MFDFSSLVSRLSSLVFVYSPSAHIPVVCKVMMQQNTCILIYHNRSHERQRRSMLGSVMGVRAPPRTLALRICTSCNTLRFGYMKINFHASLTLLVFCRLSSLVSRLSSIYMLPKLFYYINISYIEYFCYKLSFYFGSYENITTFFAIFAALWKMLLLQVWAAFPL